MAKSPFRRQPGEEYDSWRKRIHEQLREADSVRESRMFKLGENKPSHADQFVLDMLEAAHVSLEGHTWFYVGPIDPNTGRVRWRCSLNNFKGWRKQVLILRKPFGPWDPAWGTHRVALNGLRVLAHYLIGRPLLTNLIPHNNGTVEDPKLEWVSRSELSRRLTPEKLRIAREMKKEGKTMEEVARRLGMSRSTLYKTLPVDLTTTHGTPKSPCSEKVASSHRYPVKLHRPEDREEVHAEKTQQIQDQLVRDGRSDAPIDTNRVQIKHQRKGKVYTSKNVATFATDKAKEQDDYEAMLDHLAETDAEKLKEREAENVDSETDPNDSVSKTEEWQRARSKSEKLGLGPLPLGLQAGSRGKVGEQVADHPPQADAQGGREHESNDQESAADDVAHGAAEEPDEGLTDVSHEEPPLDVKVP